MMDSLALTQEVVYLCGTALLIGFVHTLTGPDHYVPFVAISQARRWSLSKTICVTLLCGFGHVGSSILLGLFGVSLGVVLLQLETIEAQRGDAAGWLLLGFGLIYFLWGVVHALRRTPHRHISIGRRGIRFWQHEHGADAAEQAAPETGEHRGQSVTLWVLAIVFLLGPCEPLIPMLMYPAAKAHTLAVVYVSALFALATLLTMTLMVVIMRLGVRSVRISGMQHYTHAACGLALLVCGALMKFGL